jgi:hypothetical protein
MYPDRSRGFTPSDFVAFSRVVSVFDAPPALPEADDSPVTVEQQCRREWAKLAQKHPVTRGVRRSPKGIP